MMRRPLITAVGLLIALGLAANVGAVPFTIQIGDNDGFGFGAAAVPDGAPLLNINLPEDRRSATEAAGTNGVQQTDFYSANFNPLPEVFDIIFPLAAPLVSATFEVDMGGFQADQFRPLSVAYNGVLQPGLWDFQDGIFDTAVRQFVLDAAAIANANLAGEFRVTVGRNASVDAIAFDYFKLEGEQVPEPATLVLLGAGLAGLGLRRRRGGPRG